MASRRLPPLLAAPIPAAQVVAAATRDHQPDPRHGGAGTGAERIRGELLKLGIKVSKRTVQKYMRGIRGKNGGGQRWATFVKNHAERMWACDFIHAGSLTVTDSSKPVAVTSVLGGLHVDYRRAA